MCRELCAATGDGTMWPLVCSSRCWALEWVVGSSMEGAPYEKARPGILRDSTSVRRVCTRKCGVGRGRVWRTGLDSSRAVWCSDIVR